jgi:CheY-like chemotaxis protein
LLVDDEPDAISTLQFRLEGLGYGVLTASNGLEAMDRLRDTKVDLILADFMMPELNGLELARMVKESPKWFDTRIILFSCNSDPEFRKRAIQLGALDFLSKTEGYTAIVERVAEVAPVKKLLAEPGATTAQQEAIFRDQLHSLSRSLVDVLQIAGLSNPLPEPTRCALVAAKRIADDIERLTSSEDELAAPVEPTRLNGE